MATPNEKRNLEGKLQALYDSEIVTITMLWDGGVDFAFVSSMELEETEPKTGITFQGSPNWPMLSTSLR